MMPPTLRPLTKTERRDLKRRLGKIRDLIEQLDRDEQAIRDARSALYAERAKINAQVYRS